MTQTPRNTSFQKAVGQRLDTLVKRYLKVSWKRLGDLLGYSNSSVLLRSRDGETSLSAEKLAVLATLDVAMGGGRISIDWLLTGRGTPIQSDGPDSAGLSTSLGTRVESAAPEIQNKIAAFLEVHEGRTKSP